MHAPPKHASTRPVPAAIPIMAPALREDASGATVAVDSAIAVVIGAEAGALEEVMVVPGIVVGTVFQNGDVATVGCAVVDGSTAGTSKVMLVLPDTLITVVVTGVDLTVDGVIAGDNVAEEVGFGTSMGVDALAPVSLSAAGVEGNGTTGGVNGSEAGALEEVMVFPGIVVGTVFQNGGEVTVGCVIVGGSEVGSAKVALLPGTLLTVSST
ncbi:hypothetical protein, partial [Endozoicomonas sp. ALC013]|uniref:hypothetical protein n=1 Tax=Endozoicomonas sp. ALC013 TaxID=3403076 RepID=UPI003BB59879